MEPKIRLKGFCGKWVSHSLKEKEFTIVAGGDIDKQSIRQHGRYPVIANALSNDGIVGYYDQYYRIEAPAVSVTGRGEIGYAQARKTSFTPVVRLLSIQSHHDVDFLANAINCKKVVQESTGVPQLTTDKLSQYEIAFPEKIEEEKAIGNYISSIDSLIQSTTKKIESLKQIKAASLQSMFPQGGEKIPSVRFNKFNSEWRICKLGAILTERHEVSTITEELPQLSFTIADGVIRPEDRKTNQRDFLIKDKDNKRYLITRVGDIIYNPANVVFGAIHRNSLIDGVVSPIYRIFYTNQDSRFIECVVRRPSFISQLAMRTEGTVTKLKTLKPEAFLDMEVCIPTDQSEQIAIGEYFRNLDRQINLQTKRLEKLKQIKSACLDNMFV